MNGENSRRRILKLASTLPMTLPLVTLASTDDGSRFSFHRVKRQMTAEGVRSGTLVIVDTDVTGFNGDGYYLYPDWGKPVVYQVKEQNDRLVFYYPGASKALWKMAAGKASPMFSGRIEGIVDADTDNTAIARHPAIRSLPLLKVPAFPPVA